MRKFAKDSLDRRYAVHEQVEVLQSELAAVSLAVENLRRDLQCFVEGASNVVQRLDGVEKDTIDLTRRLEDVVLATRPSVDFASVGLPELKARLADANRLANESALAIEELLQQEMLIRRDLNALVSPD